MDRIEQKRLHTLNMDNQVQEVQEVQVEHCIVGHCRRESISDNPTHPPSWLNPSLNSYKNWVKVNKNILEHLYYKLINLSKSYSISIMNNNESFNNFLKMMYYESNKKLINKNLFPEYHNKRFNSEGYQNYKILDISR